MRLRAGLFLRTFLLIGALIVVSVLSSLQLVQVFDRSPPEQQLAWEIAAIVNLTRSALVNTVGERRFALLSELSRSEGVRVLPLEPQDRIEPIGRTDSRDADFARRVEARLRGLLGHPTIIAGGVNDERALWVSFDIDGDEYWLVMDRERFDRQHGPPWATIALVALALSGLGGLAISQLVNRPLARLADALGTLSRGEQPSPLPEAGASEIADLNRRFNRMAGELAAVESDRAVALAGISHDIRTPLTRLRLEIELSPLPSPTRDSMAEEIDRIDRIVGKFVDYGRAAGGEPAEHPIDVDLAALVSQTEATQRARQSGGMLALSTELAPGSRWFGDPLDLIRILDNLIENAIRHGRTTGTQRSDVRLRLWREHGMLCIEVGDEGPGLPPAQAQGMLRPFSQLNAARGGDAGAGTGLGLAIVMRIAQRYGGSCELASGSLAQPLLAGDSPASGSTGLRVLVRLADASSSSPRSGR